MKRRTFTPGETMASETLTWENYDRIVGERLETFSVSHPFYGFMYKWRLEINIFLLLLLTVLGCILGKHLSPPWYDFTALDLLPSFFISLFVSLLLSISISRTFANAAYRSFMGDGAPHFPKLRDFFVD